MAFRPAVRAQQRLRMAIAGPSGSGKTLTALRMAMALGDRVGVIDTERGRASLYEGRVEDGKVIAFQVEELADYHPDNYIRALNDGKGHFDVMVVDSLTHAWNGTNGVLQQVDRAAQRARGNTYSGWKTGTPMQNRLVEALLNWPGHVIATMRTKTAYVLEKNSKGKQVPRKVGTEVIQREGIEYEFDVVGEMDADHNMVITKSRCSAIDGRSFHCPGKDVVDELKAWLQEGEARTAEKGGWVCSDSRRKEYFAVIRELGLEHDAVKAWCDGQGHRMPGQMSDAWLQAFVARLRQEGGLWQRAAAQGEDTAAATEGAS